MTGDRHLRLAIASLAAFVAGGLWLEAMVGLRPDGWMEDTVRRELVRLGHAHGAALSLVNVALAWAMERLRTPVAWAERVRPAALFGALLVGAGFIGGGLWHGLTDPGPVVLLVPAGALMLLGSLVAVASVRGSVR